MDAIPGNLCDRPVCLVTDVLCCVHGDMVPQPALHFSAFIAEFKGKNLRQSVSQTHTAPLRGGQQKMREWRAQRQKLKVPSVGTDPCHPHVIPPTTISQIHTNGKFRENLRSPLTLLYLHAVTSSHINTSGLLRLAGTSLKCGSVSLAGAALQLKPRQGFWKLPRQHSLEIC